MLSGVNNFGDQILKLQANRASVGPSSTAPETVTGHQISDGGSLGERPTDQELNLLSPANFSSIKHSLHSTEVKSDGPIKDFLRYGVHQALEISSPLLGLGGAVLQLVNDHGDYSAQLKERPAPTNLQANAEVGTRFFKTELPEGTSVTVYPNPLDGELTMLLSGQGKPDVRVDFRGQQASMVTISEGTSHLDIRDQGRGVFMSAHHDDTHVTGSSAHGFSSEVQQSGGIIERRHQPMSGFSSQPKDPSAQDIQVLSDSSQYLLHQFEKGYPGSKA